MKSILPNKSKDQEMEVPCTKCAIRTNHLALQTVDVSGEEDLGFGQRIFWEEVYQIIQCQACKTISFRLAQHNSEDIVQISHDEFDYVISEKLYPSRVEGRKQLKDRRFLPSNVRMIYEETHQALCNGLRVLAGVGLRAIIEAVCKDKAATGANLNEKIDDLANKGMLTQDGALILHRLRTLGNKAAHEVQPHSQEQLALAMDVAEHLLEGAYIFPEKVRRAFK